MNSEQIDKLLEGMGRLNSLVERVDEQQLRYACLELVTSTYGSTLTPMQALAEAGEWHQWVLEGNREVKVERETHEDNDN